MSELQEKVAIVTGGASGIGKAIAQKLAKEGATVVIGDVNETMGTAVSASLNAHFIQGDLSCRADCQTLIQQTIEKFGRVDILINNAGFQHIDPVSAFPEDQWDKMIALMLTAPFLLTRYSWPTMQANGWGRIINISSVHGLVASPFKSAYISAKHGLIGLTRTTALEGGPHGITVNAICPAYVRTPLVEGQIADQARTHNIAKTDVVEKIMLKDAAIKELIEPSDIADLVTYLCSKSGRLVTGVSWTIDGGWTAR